MPLDPLQGIYLAQGSLLQHLVFLAMIFYVFSLEPHIEEQRYELPILFAFFKLSGGFTCFFANMFCIQTNDSVLDVI